jgi:hypothetical protein
VLIASLLLMATWLGDIEKGGVDDEAGGGSERGS